MKKNKHIGSSLDEFLEEEGIGYEVEILAIKKIIVCELQLAMKKSKLSKTKMAQLMKTSRAQIDRLLDPNNQSITLSTLSKAALVTGKKLEISLKAA
ncbi:MAG: hypothetical protein SFU25_00610 [Candidatus Caenarcaniphilales bacterium]|nr:hypothetical protein [Candidatus Caenarcaniphilales bacterium]